MIDEAERQTLVSGDGLPYHVRVGDRFLDTLLAVRGESQPKFRLNYGFDVSNPVAVAKTLIAPPERIGVTPAKKAAAFGWFIHVAPKDIVLTEMEVQRRDDGLLAAIVRVVQTRSKSCTAVLRFIRDVKHARVIEDFGEDAIHRPIAQEHERGGLSSKGDQVTLPLVGHQVVDVLVIFAADSNG